MEDILTKIQRIYPKFTDKEKQIADFIMQKGKSMRNINISVFAK